MHGLVGDVRNKASPRQPLRHRRTVGIGAELAAEIGRASLLAGELALDDLVDALRRFLQLWPLVSASQPVQQHAAGQDHRRRVGDVLAGNVGGGAMHRLRHAMVGTSIAAVEAVPETATACRAL